MVTFSENALALTKKIPLGKVTTYKEIAKALGSKAYRAVGAALKHNRHPLTVPCHRVIASDLSLGGYCGKLKNPKKAALLKKEGIMMNGNKVNKQHLLRFS